MHRVANQPHGLSREELQVCDVMGIDPSRMAQQKSLRQGSSAHGAMPQAQTVRMVRTDQMFQQSHAGRGTPARLLTPQAYLDSLKKQVPQPGPGTPDLTPQEMEVCRKMNIDPVKFADWRKRSRGIPLDGQRT